MGMSAPSGGSNLNNDMNVTPMIDVLLVLLIKPRDEVAKA
jgi:biopolymer transport protein ExbD